MSNHSIKISRALAQSGVGRYPGSAHAMLAAVPESIVAALTSRQIADMLDAMWSACQTAKADANREAVDEGAVWDARRQTLRELAA